MPEIPAATVPPAIDAEQFQAAMDAIGQLIKEAMAAFRDWAADALRALTEAIKLAEVFAGADRRRRAEIAAMHREYHRRRNARQRRNR